MLATWHFVTIIKPSLFFTKLRFQPSFNNRPKSRQKFGRFGPKNLSQKSPKIAINRPIWSPRNWHSKMLGNGAHLSSLAFISIGLIIRCWKCECVLFLKQNSVLLICVTRSDRKSHLNPGQYTMPIIWDHRHSKCWHKNSRLLLFPAINFNSLKFY